MDSSVVFPTIFLYEKKFSSFFYPSFFFIFNFLRLLKKFFCIHWSWKYVWWKYVNTCLNVIQCLSSKQIARKKEIFLHFWESFLFGNSAIHKVIFLFDMQLKMSTKDVCKIWKEAEQQAKKNFLIVHEMAMNFFNDGKTCVLTFEALFCALCYDFFWPIRIYCKKIITAK